MLFLLVYIIKWLSDTPIFKENHQQQQAQHSKSSIQVQQRQDQNGANSIQKEYNANQCVNHHQSIKINYFNRQTFQGKNFNGKVFIPAEFLSSQFGWVGESQNLNGEKVWSISKRKARVVDPIGRYNYKGPFTWFNFYKVEKRERVKYIDSVTGVPISTQWSQKGYFYPTQICQFALSHFTRLLLNGTKINQRILFDCKSMDIVSTWKVHQTTSIQCIDAIVDGPNKRVMKFAQSHSSKAMSLNMQSSFKRFIARFEVQFKGSGSISFLVTTKRQQQFTIRYSTAKVGVSFSERSKTVIYGIGTRNVLSRITRDLEIDLCKALLLERRRKGSRKGALSKKAALISVDAVTLQGSGLLGKLSLVDSADKDFFIDAANWLVANQDRSGGWPVSVSHKINKLTLTLKPGWYSAMAQGQAMSTLTRAFHLTKEYKYLRTALLATKPFHIPASEGGVLATVFGTYKFYEEYPTKIPLLVLNGFIYSLFGLYDLKSAVEDVNAHNITSDAAELYRDGIRTLKNLLPLYDAGSDTFYDLRHVVIKAEPIIARSTYHALHISQLLHIDTIEEDPLFARIAKRWMEYMNGGRANHN
ncbi:uncharacterized protein TRIADDRAFT_27335 [Trichoplax adhaerens]|uniref:heparosan-N-sulfate-glucuronate 5-epimerase n=1 Tax=Trichoplax adhaerens TaxID=10228 RepID=B3S022_TRIAD|nr:hypothetical protein TRIADDRAFT_27335 [Trichoplax adhaerens]EDV24314.1 hypothetical protein TRIADDRAFT_27335 [Trichoplax adhaerens]|eukprot:XP_002113840.1 hypothetical protein TRIADDRAFT_27335 [Trichoplax adhaerens]